MQKKFNNCELGGTPNCPKITEPIMQKLFWPSRKDTESVTYGITETDINARNQICSECNSFMPFQNK
jgi:hypothetical protein